MKIFVYFLLLNFVFRNCEKLKKRVIYSNHIFLNGENPYYPYVSTSSTIYNDVDQHFLLNRADCSTYRKNYVFKIQNRGCQNLNCPVTFNVYKAGKETYNAYSPIYKEVDLQINQDHTSIIEKSACEIKYLTFEIPSSTLVHLRNTTFVNMKDYLYLHISIREHEVEKIYKPVASTPQYILLIAIFFLGSIIIISVLCFCFFSLIYISVKYKGIIFKRTEEQKIMEIADGFTFENDIIEYGDMISFGSYGFIRQGVYHKKTDVGEMEIPVAIKMIVLNKQSGERHVSHEVKIMKKLNHKNIIKCYGVKFQKKFAHIIMELCEKGDLHRCLKKCEITEKAKVKILLQIANGMDYLHKKGIVHRDLKTQNVLLTKKNEVKICDFGTAKNINSVSQTLCGTVEYLAPEQYDINLLNKPKKIDIYSFGIICWEVSSSLDPFEDIRKSCNGNELEMIQQIHTNKIRPDLMKCNNMPLDLKILMQECWQHFPIDRPKNFEVILERLSKILDSYGEDDSDDTETTRNSSNGDSVFSNGTEFDTIKTQIDTFKISEAISDDDDDTEMEFETDSGSESTLTEDLETEEDESSSTASGGDASE